MPQLPFTHFLNGILAGPVNSLLNAVGHPAANADAPISNWFAMEVLVVGGLMVFFMLVRMRLSAENPGGFQHMAELLNEFIGGQSEEIIGHHSEKYTPFLAALFLFILFANLIGLIPTLASPTANPAVP